MTYNPIIETSTILTCPTCQSLNLTPSTICQGLSTMTLIYTPSFYDKQGKRHRHNPNRATTEYTCGNGHHWVEKSKGDECWCGWKLKDEDDEK